VCLILIIYKILYKTLVCMTEHFLCTYTTYMVYVIKKYARFTHILYIIIMLRYYIRTMCNNVLQLANLRHYTNTWSIVCIYKCCMFLGFQCWHFIIYGRMTFFCDYTARFVVWRRRWYWIKNVKKLPNII